MFKFSKAIRLAAATCLIATVTCTSSFALNMGTITADSLNLKASASTSSAVLSELQHGRMVAVLEQGETWSKVAVNSQTGYVESASLKNYNCDADFTVGTGVVTANSLNVRTQPNTSGDILVALKKGASVDVIGITGTWYKVTTADSVTGYVCPDYINITNATPAESQVEGSAIVASAKAQIGKPYVSGSKGPNAFDCSGLTYYVYKQNGYTLASNSRSQYSTTTRVAKSDLQPGDLVFFSNSASGGQIGHVGIYAGDGQYIHAPSPGKTVCYASMNSSWSARHYIGAGRVG